MKAKELIKHIKSIFVIGGVLSALFAAFCIGIFLFFIAGGIFLLSEKLFFREKILKC